MNTLYKPLLLKNLATCQSPIQQGVTKTLSSLASNGTPPYHYHWSITAPDGTVNTSPTQQSLNYTFNQLGNYNISTYVTDSCATGSKMSNVDSCTVNVTSVQPPPSLGCINCDLTRNYCIAGNCVPRNYVVYAGIGFGALFLLSLLE